MNCFSLKSSCKLSYISNRTRIQFPTVIKYVIFPFQSSTCCVRSLCTQEQIHKKELLLPSTEQRFNLYPRGRNSFSLLQPKSLNIWGQTNKSRYFSKFGSGSKLKVSFDSIGFVFNKEIQKFTLYPRGFLKWTRRKLVSLNCLLLLKYRHRKNYKKTFTRRSFRGEATQLYTKFLNAFAKGDAAILRQLTTDSFFTEMKKDIPIKTQFTTKWELGSINLNIANVFLYKVPLSLLEYVQITVYVRTSQSLKYFNQKNQLVAGSEKNFHINEYIVFERKLDPQEQTEWRICGRAELSK